MVLPLSNFAKGETYMRTIDQRFTTSASLWPRLWSDVRLLWRMGQMFWAYFIVGSRIRRAYRTKAARGETFWVDEELQP
jgi:hypothetical protein